MVKFNEHPQLKILIVDDEPDLLDVLYRNVTSFGYECVTAANGLQAIEILKQQKIDVVVTDVFMPQMDGLQLLAHVKKHHVDTDVIVVTGYVNRTSYSDVIKAGAVDYIRKPFERDVIEAKLSRVERERQLVHKLERLSLSDPLTGLLNRRSFDQKLLAEVQRAHRQDHEVYLALLDIDEFKGFNDTYGHSAGDQALIAVGVILNTCIRQNVDFAFRYGGDEFATILTETNKEQAIEIMKRVRDGFQQADFTGTGLSIGLVPCRCDENEDWQINSAQMINLADKALYDAKSGGKNQVVMGG